MAERAHLDEEQQESDYFLHVPAPYTIHVRVEWGFD